MKSAGFKRGRTHRLPGDIAQSTRIRLLEKGRSRLAKSLRKDEHAIIDKKFRRDQSYLNEK